MVPRPPDMVVADPYTGSSTSRSAAELEVVVANKDKGGKSNKKVATKNLKEKRQEKKSKRDAADKRQSKIT